MRHVVAWIRVVWRKHALPLRMRGLDFAADAT